MPSKITATRYHDISCGHRVAGHEGKCQHLHGHNYRIHFTLSSPVGTDHLGRVLDFGVIKEKLCMWIEKHWDHKFLAWEHDPILQAVHQAVNSECDMRTREAFNESIVWVPFNPTAENMAQHLVQVVGPLQLKDTGCRLDSVVIEETMKCHAGFHLVL